ncbi:MAG: hypothetical protein ACR2JV_03620 [Gaiellales bacterium]
MHRILTIVAVAGLMLALGATAAFADGSQTTTPTSKQKAGIVKAWNGGKAVSSSKLKCYTVAISKGNKVWAGLMFNTKASGCSASAFDGSALLWGSGSSWNLLTEGSDLPAGTCTALASVLGPNGWVDLVNYASGLGCQNID